MSWRIKGHAQYNYFPQDTRPGGVGEVRRHDPKRPDLQPTRPGRKSGHDVKRPHR